MAEKEIEKAPIRFGGSVQAVVPQDMDQVWRVATIIVQSGMAPKAFAGNDNAAVNKVTVAIMHGMEVGLPPMAALQSIAVINGMPSIWGDGALALVQSSGLLEDMEERIDGDGDDMTAYCMMKRRDRKTPIERRFSAEDAKQALLWGKQGPWQNYPKRMLQMRARGLAMRDGFTECLKGLHIGEEAQDNPAGPDHARDVTPRPTREQYEAPKAEAPREVEGEVVPDFNHIDKFGEIVTVHHNALEYVTAIFTEAERIDIPGAVVALYEHNEADLNVAVLSLNDEQEQQYYTPLIEAYNEAVKAVADAKDAA